MDPIGNDTFMTGRSIMSRAKSSLPTHPKKMADGTVLPPEQQKLLAHRWEMADKLPRLSEFLMWVAGQKLGRNSPIAQIVIVTKPLSFLKPSRLDQVKHSLLV